MAAKKQPDADATDLQNGVIARNKKARFKFELLEHFEAGLVLKGSEIKSIRNRDVALDQSFARMMRGELFLVGMNIAPYDKGGYANHEPLRPRKLLLHRRQIEKIVGQLGQSGFTLVPVTLYLKQGLAKVDVALARGKREFDKREDIKRRDADRSIKRALSQGRRGDK